MFFDLHDSDVLDWERMAGDSDFVLLDGARVAHPLMYEDNIVVSL